MLGLVDYGSGNLPSVQQALQREGGTVQLVDAPEKLKGVRAVVLPGVGAFGDAVRNLQERSLWEPLGNWLASRKPFLGICLGYQLLFESSEETPGVEGFGFFRGQVRKFASTELKIPHMGWNTLQLVERETNLWRGLPQNAYVFFVHSFFPAPADESIVSAWATYGEKFAAAISTGNLAATQFHPEKSQTVGLTMLRNFIAGL